MGNNLSFIDLADTSAVTPRYTVKDFCVGNTHVCAVVSGVITSDDKVKCWGKNAAGQGARGDNTNRFTEGGAGTPVDYANLSATLGAVEIAAGNNHACAVPDNNLTK